MAKASGKKQAVAGRTATAGAKKPVDWEAMSVEEFNAAVERVGVLTKEYAAKVQAEFGATPRLTEDERRHAPRIPPSRYPGYFAALDVADLRPDTFKYLADKDNGLDPNKFETDLLRERLTKHQGFTTLSQAIAPVAGLLSDGPLSIALQVAEPLSQTYGLAKGMAAIDKVAHGIMADAISTNSAVAKKAAAKRAANKKAGGK